MDDASGRFFCFGDGDRGVETVQLLPQMVCEELRAKCMLK